MRRAVLRTAARHCLFVALARRRDDPADAERLTPRRPHFDRHLIGGAADAAGAHFDRRHDVVERLLEHVTGLCLVLPSMMSSAP